MAASVFVKTNFSANAEVQYRGSIWKGPFNLKYTEAADGSLGGKQVQYRVLSVNLVKTIKLERFHLETT